MTKYIVTRQNEVAALWYSWPVKKQTKKNKTNKKKPSGAQIFSSNVQMYTYIHVWDIFYYCTSAVKLGDAVICMCHCVEGLKE